MKAMCCVDFRIDKQGKSKPCAHRLADFMRGEEYEVDVKQDTLVVNGYLQEFWQATVRAPYDDEFGFPRYAIFNAPIDINHFFTFK